MGILDERKNSSTRRAAARADFFKQPRFTAEKPKEWSELPLFINVEYIARLLEINEATISAWCRTGKLPATKKASKWIVKKDDFIEFMDRDKTKKGAS